MMPTARWPVTRTRAPTLTIAGSPPISWYVAEPWRRIRQRGSTPASIWPVSTMVATEAPDDGADGVPGIDEPGDDGAGDTEPDTEPDAEPDAEPEGEPDAEPAPEEPVPDCAQAVRISTAPSRP